MLALPALLPLLLALPAGTLAHQSIWTASMYGVGPDFAYSANSSEASVGSDPVAPLGPDWTSQDDWWFRGPAFRALSPAARGSSAVTDLVAGGSVTFEIACNVAWTSFGCCEWETAYYDAQDLDACPGNSGAYHSGDPDVLEIDDDLLSGCALAIADVDDIEDVTWDNLAIFSVNHTCVRWKDTSFEVPAEMPACTGEKCICGWFWLANNGTANFYMTAFDCSVSNVSPTAKQIAAPVDPVFCPEEQYEAGTCTRQAGAKRPLYAYNEPTNVVWQGNDHRPGYHASWSFPNDGAQNDIFVTANVTTSSAVSSVASATSSTVSSSVTSELASTVASATSSVSATVANLEATSALSTSTVQSSVATTSLRTTATSSSADLAAASSSSAASASSAAASSSSASAASASAAASSASVASASVASASSASAQSASQAASSSSSAAGARSSSLAASSASAAARSSSLAASRSSSLAASSSKAASRSSSLAASKSSSMSASASRASSKAAAASAALAKEAAVIESLLHLRLAAAATTSSRKSASKSKYVSLSRSKSESKSLSKSRSRSKSKSKSVSKSKAKSKSLSLSRSRSLSKSESRSESKSLSRSRSLSKSKSKSKSKSLSRSKSLAKAKASAVAKAKAKLAKGGKRALADEEAL